MALLLAQIRGSRIRGLELRLGFPVYFAAIQLHRAAIALLVTPVQGAQPSSILHPPQLARSIAEQGGIHGGRQHSVISGIGTAARENDLFRLAHLFRLAQLPGRAHPAPGALLFGTPFGAFLARAFLGTLL